MSKQKSLVKKIREWAKAEGVKVKITNLPADLPAPLTGLTGEELADYFSNPKPKPNGKGGKNGK